MHFKTKQSAPSKNFRGQDALPWDTPPPPLHQYVTLKCVLKNYSEGQLDKF